MLLINLTNIPLALLRIGKPSSLRKLSLYATFKFFKAALEDRIIPE